MSKIKIGDAKAYCKTPNRLKARYYKVGVLYKDSDRGGLSLKIDTLPIQGLGWDGWINIFEEDKKSETAVLDSVICPVCADPVHRDAKGFVCSQGHRAEHLPAPADDDIPF